MRRMTMSADKFNEAEKYLLDNWQQACLVEKSMKAVRGRYQSTCDRVWEAIKDKHKELDWHDVSPLRYNGIVGIGRNTWPGEPGKGAIYIGNLLLEYLLDDNSPSPRAGIWVGTRRKPLIDDEGIKRVLCAAETLLAREEFEQCVKESVLGDGYILWYRLPEERRTLVGMLLDGDGQQFVDCLVTHLEVFTRFIPILDEVFLKPTKK
jgi:hypothetical protein